MKLRLTRQILLDDDAARTALIGLALRVPAFRTCHERGRWFVTLGRRQFFIRLHKAQGGAGVLRLFVCPGASAVQGADVLVGFLAAQFAFDHGRLTTEQSLDLAWVGLEQDGQVCLYRLERHVGHKFAGEDDFELSLLHVASVSQG